MTDEEFLDRYEDAKAGILSLCRSFGSSRGPGMVDEYMQVVLVKLWMKKHLYHHDTSFRAWACTVTRNTLISIVRRNGRMYEILDEVSTKGMYKPAESPAPDEVYEAKESHQELMGILSELKPVFRDVVILVELRGLPYKEVAEQLDIPIGTVMSRLYRARKALGINPRGGESGQ
jgi:RNA polymerase sigma-70 factor, ECF subfamily